ncbi:sulfatase-like hydrolase/transferase [Sphingobacterium sp. DR205]|nr:sulfatase-like hydrolase/transferase [Sphingobacterium sp. DR205]
MHTPHIDELAKHGILFQCAYASASVCAPSRAEWEAKNGKAQMVEFCFG